MKLEDYPTPETDQYIGEYDEDTMTEGEIAMCQYAASLERRLAACREVLGELERYPIARGYPDGPCLNWEDMNDIKEVLELTKP